MIYLPSYLPTYLRVPVVMLNSTNIHGHLLNITGETYHTTEIGSQNIHVVQDRAGSSLLLDDKSVRRMVMLATNSTPRNAGLFISLLYNGHDNEHPATSG